MLEQRYMPDKRVPERYTVPPARNCGTQQAETQPETTGLAQIGQVPIVIINPDRLPPIQLAWATISGEDEIISLRQFGREIVRLPGDHIGIQTVDPEDQLGPTINRRTLLTP